MKGFCLYKMKPIYFIQFFKFNDIQSRYTWNVLHQGNGSITHGVSWSQRPVITLHLICLKKLYRERVESERFKPHLILIMDTITPFSSKSFSCEFSRIHHIDFLWAHLCSTFIFCDCFAEYNENLDYEWTGTQRTAGWRWRLRRRRRLLLLLVREESFSPAAAAAGLLSAEAFQGKTFTWAISFLAHLLHLNNF